jgi:CDGSH-type Zn-finger protein
MSEETQESTYPAQTARREPLEVVVTSGKTYWWCACGRSQQQPFCDGSHKATKFTPLKFQAAETGPKLFCVCKRTLTPPFCDGTASLCASAILTDS